MDALAERVVIELVMGLTNGMVLALVASGFTLILGVMNIVNFAHGEFHMAGAYAGWLLLALVGLVVGPAVGFWITVVLAAAVVGVMGWIVERGVLAETHGGNPFIPLLISFGLQASNFVPNAEQTESTKTILRVLYAALPFTMLLVGAWVVSRLQLDEQEHSRIRAELDRRRGRSGG